MKSIIFVIQYPADDEKNKQIVWRATQDKLQNRKMTSKGATMLTPGCWLIHASDGLHLLSECMSQAIADGLKIRLITLDDNAELSPDKEPPPPEPATKT